MEECNSKENKEKSGCLWCGDKKTTFFCDVFCSGDYLTILKLYKELNIPLDEKETKLFKAIPKFLKVVGK